MGVNVYHGIKQTTGNFQVCILACKHTHTSEIVALDNTLSGQIKGPSNQCALSESSQQQMNGKKWHQVRMKQSSPGEFLVPL